MRTPTLLAAAVVALALSACGDSGNDDTASAPSNAGTAAAATTTGPAAPTNAPEGEFDMTAKEFAFTPTEIEANAKNGKIEIDVTNEGAVPHELVVIKTDKGAGNLGGGSHVSERGAIGEIEEIKPGESEDKEFKVSPGHYALICNLPGHYAGGMYADLTVK